VELIRERREFNSLNITVKNGLIHTDVNVAILEGGFPHKAVAQQWVSIFLEAASGALASISQLFLRKSAEVAPHSGMAGQTVNSFEDVTRSSRQKHELKRLQKNQSELVQSNAYSQQRLDGLEAMLRDDELRHTVVLYINSIISGFFATIN